MARAVAYVLVGAFVAWLLVGLGFVNYDTVYSLNWGHELAEGRSPDLTVERAPTPKPLVIAGGFVLTPLEHAAQPVVAAGALLALGALAATAFALASSVSGTLAGLIAAVVLLTREPVLSFGVRAYVDIPYVALVLAAVALALRRPARPAAVLGALAIAGLLRPEAWLLAAAFVAYVALVSRPGPVAVLRLIGLALLAPAIWLATDAALVGDALWSLTGTQEGARTLERPTGLDDAVRLAPRRIGEIVREPVLFAAVGGLVLCLGPLRSRAAPLLGAVVAAGCAFAVLAAAGLPVLGRYLLLTGAFVVVLASIGVAEAARHAVSRSWAARAFLAAALALFLALLPAQVERLDGLRSTIASQRAINDDLHRVVHRDLARATCRAVAVPNHRVVPLLAGWLDRSAARFPTSARRRGGALVLPANRRVARLFVLDRTDPVATDLSEPAGFEQRYANRSWRVVAHPTLCPA